MNLFKIQIFLIHISLVTIIYCLSPKKNLNSKRYCINKNPMDSYQYELNLEYPIELILNSNEDMNRKYSEYYNSPLIIIPAYQIFNRVICITSKPKSELDLIECKWILKHQIKKINFDEIVYDEVFIDQNLILSNQDFIKNFAWVSLKKI